MYTACLYCSRSLGTNEVIEQFPVGRRLAFDATRGRLWVVCTRCQRWCLSPLEERWEAIEACERSFRDARVRASTREIGLVRLREGLELVRIGAPLQPEFAAWRYGRELSTRRRRSLALTAAATAVASLAGAAVAASGAGQAYLGLVAISGVATLHLTALAGFIGYSAYDSARAVKLQIDGKAVRVYRADLRESHLLPDDSIPGWGIRLKHSYGRKVLTGDEATRVASRLLARVNGYGAARHLVDSSVRQLVEAPSLNAFIRDAALRSGALADAFSQRRREWIYAMERNVLSAGKFDETANPGGLTWMSPPVRLALEMALHEQSERVALEGELAPLVAAWREAEEIAGIADRLLTPPSVDAQLDALRARDIK